MANESSVLQVRMERLRRLHLRALGSFNAYEQLQMHRARNILGQDIAHQHALDIGRYKGFFNIAEKALLTEMHISVAKLFDSHKDALHIEKLINYAEQNQSLITPNQQQELNDNEAATEIAKVYKGLSRAELLHVKTQLNNASDKIERLKEVRDKQVAHENIREPVLRYLTFQELHELIELSETIMNLISSRLFASSAWTDLYKKQVVDDTKALLDLVSRHRKD